MPKLITQEDYMSRVLAIHGKKYDYSKLVYKAAKVPVEVICREHGSFFIVPTSFTSRGSGCSKCVGRGADWVDRFKSIHGDLYDYSKVKYIGKDLKVSIGCSVHGEFFQSPDNHFRGKQGCPKCKGSKIRKSKQLTFEVFKERAQAIHPDKFTYEAVEWSNMQMPTVAVTCEHGTNMQRPVNHLSGQITCNKCGNMKSQDEEAIADFLAQYTVVERRNRQIIAPKEIDIYLPEFKMGIEYHGLYWHSSPRTHSNYHREKYEAANKAGIRLVQIFEDEWLDKQDIVKNRLLAFIGKAPQYQARKLKLSQIPMSEARPFLVATHIQGAGVASYCYALKDEENIVAVATFGKARSGAMTGAKVEGRWEVTRYASTGRVQGGFSRLLKQFKTEVDPNEIISYCDLRYGDGKLYEATGFTLASITEPDYWWVPKGEVKRIPRYSVQKHKLADPKHQLNKFYAPTKTENEICTEAGWSKIHGVGSQKWIWSK